jgi:hypothetical protein
MEIAIANDCALREVEACATTSRLEPARENQREQPSTEARSRVKLLLDAKFCPLDKDRLLGAVDLYSMQDNPRIACKIWDQISALVDSWIARENALLARLDEQQLTGIADSVSNLNADVNDASFHSSREESCQ